MTEQAQPRPYRGRIVAIASGKGGVGKTWLAITLTHALALAGARPLLVDCDLGLANIDIQLGLMPQADIGALAEGRLGIAKVIARHEAGFDVVAGRSGSGALADLPAASLRTLWQTLAQSAGGYDAVLLDLCAGLDPAGRQLARLAHGLLLVVTDEPTSLTDAYAVLKLHAAEAGSLGSVQVVVNQASSHAAGERTYAMLERACTTFLRQAPALAGVVRADPRVREAIRRQTPLLTRSPSTQAARDVDVIARALAAS